MKIGRIEQQRHGYLGGHQLLARSTSLSRADQDLVDRLSDIGGQPGPHDAVPDYLTGYPLPSGQFFAFARTWYDHSAPRAGCVLTHTLLIPSALWSQAPSILALTALHEIFDREASSKPLPTISFTAGPREVYPPATNDGLSALCEAVFLEDRRPIAWLTEPNDCVVLRLVEAFWPALRSRFAFQTYALKPRSQASGPFDLMVVPRTARGRFSAWEGRRIDGDAPARHAFTPLLTEAIFRAPLPSLEAADPLGLLAEDDVGDPAKLRLSILWNSLAVNATNDPDAALGMLDVLSAASLKKDHRWKLAEPLFQSVLSAAAKNESRAATLIKVALGKLETGDGARLNSAIAKSTTKLTRTDPEAAIKLAASAWRDSSATPVLHQAVAEAIGKLPRTQGWRALSNAPRGLTAELLRRNDTLLPHLVEGAEEDSIQWKWLVNALADLDERDLAQARTSTLSRIRTSEQVPVLRQLTVGLDAPELSRTIELLEKGGGLEDGMIVQTIVDLKSPSRLDKMQAFLEADIRLSRKRQLLASVLRPTADDLTWLLDANIDPTARSTLLIQLLTHSHPAERQAMRLFELKRLDDVLDCILGTEDGDRLVANLLREAADFKESTWARLVSHFGTGKSPSAVDAIATLIDRVVPARTLIDATRLATLLNTTAAPAAVRVAAPSLLDLLIPEQTRDEELTYSLGILIATQLDGNLRLEFQQNLALLSARASRFRVHKLSDSAYEGWASLVKDALQVPGGAATMAAESALSYVLRREFEGTLPLVCASFPKTFDSMLGPSKRERRDAEELAKAIAKLFVRNSWPAHVLLELLFQTVDPDFAIGAAASSWDGEKIIKKAMSAYPQ